MNKVKEVYCQGIKGAYSHIAAKQIFGKEPVFLRSFEDVCKSAAANADDVGILPYENSTAGIVNGIIHLLLKYDLKIIYAKTIEITHMLCAKDRLDLDDIKKVYSHQQALLQCSDFLSALKAQQIETHSTAASALLASREEGSAAVCSRQAAEIYGLTVIKENICNAERNSTRFIVVSKEGGSGDGANVTSAYFKLKNESGALYKALETFYLCGINLISLHSLPLENEPWHYGFYVDMEVANSENHIRALQKLKSVTDYLKILGVYKSE
jgi:chorismate mutase/prephenate dehydratase